MLKPSKSNPPAPTSHPSQALERWRRAHRRVSILERRLRDQAYMDRLVAAGNYLKACALIKKAIEVQDAAWSRYKADVEGDEGATPKN